MAGICFLYSTLYSAVQIHTWTTPNNPQIMTHNTGIQSTCHFRNMTDIVKCKYLYCRCWDSRYDDIKIRIGFPPHTLLMLSDTNVFVCPLLGKASQKKTPWQQTEAQAVERNMNRFITSCILPSKSECENCLRAEPEDLKNRVWQNLKFYVYNRITAYKRKWQRK